MKGVPVLTNEQQTQFAMSLLTRANKMKYKTFAMMVMDQFGVVATKSCYDRAHERLANQPFKPTTPKGDYVVALFLLHPQLSDKEIDAKTKMYLGEGIKSVDVDRYRQASREMPLKPGKGVKAREIVERVESSLFSAPALPLGDEKIADEDTYAL